FKQDIFKNSYIGLLVGDRTHDDQYNRGVGVDGRLRWRDRYSLTFQAAQSLARDQDLRAAVARLTPEQRTDLPSEVEGRTGQHTEGNAWYTELSRDTRKLNVGMSATSFSPDFSADMGFIQRTNQLDF